MTPDISLIVRGSGRRRWIEDGGELARWRETGVWERTQRRNRGIEAKDETLRGAIAVRFMEGESGGVQGMGPSSK